MTILLQIVQKLCEFYIDSKTTIECTSCMCTANNKAILTDSEVKDDTKVVIILS